MKLRFLVLILLLTVNALPALAQQTSPPLTKDQVMDLVKFGVDGAELAKRIKERGIGFEPSSGYVEALRNAGAQDMVVQALVARAAFAQESGPPLSKDQVTDLVTLVMESAKAAKIIKERGIGFEPSEDYIVAMREAGAQDVVVQALVARSAFAQESGPPLTKDHVTALVKFVTDRAKVANRIKGRGIDFEPSEDYVEALRKAGADAVIIRVLREAKPKPLTREQVGKLVAGGVPSERATVLVKQHGIDFQPDAPYLDTMRLAGADDALIAALRTAGAAGMGKLMVTTSPNAEVYLDGALQGRADAQGVLVVDAMRGSHLLGITLEGRKDFVQNVTFVGQQTTKTEARLVEIMAELVVGTSPGADVYLDGALQGRADGYGEFTVQVAVGTHSLRVSLPGRKDFLSNIRVTSQQSTVINATLN